LNQRFRRFKDWHQPGCRIYVNARLTSHLNRGKVFSQLDNGKGNSWENGESLPKE